MKIYAIGDVHGERIKLERLFSKLTIEKDDTVIFLGDYIDRGVDSKGVIDFILSLKDKCNLITLKGNHEQFAMDSYEYVFGADTTKKNMFQSWMMNGGVECLRSYDSDAVNGGYHHKALATMFNAHGDFFKNLRLTYETKKHIFVHGFLAHELDLEDQEEFQCLWGRFSDIYPHKSGKIVVCGHTIHREPVDHDFRVCIDTGSFRKDGKLTAMVIDGDKTFFVSDVD